MKAAFTLLLIALLVLPAVATVRIMLARERRRQREEGRK
jgi:heme exporter protein D